MADLKMRLRLLAQAAVDDERMIESLEDRLALLLPVVEAARELARCEFWNLLPNRMMELRAALAALDGPKR